MCALTHTYPHKNMPMDKNVYTYSLTGTFQLEKIGFLYNRICLIIGTRVSGMSKLAGFVLCWTL